MELFHLDAVEWDWEQTPSQPAALTSHSGASSSWRPATPPARRSPAGGDRYTRPATAGSARASFNAAATQNMGRITAKDTKAAGIPWVFTPILGIAVQPAWSRVMETFGEDPHLASVLGAATVRGM